MTPKEIKKQADLKRDEVKDAISKLMGLPDNIRSNLANKAVDDLVLCIILEMTSIHKEATDS